MAHRSRFAAYAGFIAAASMAVSPVQAAEVEPQSAYGHFAAFEAQDAANPFNSSAHNAEENVTEYRRRWRRYPYRRYRRGCCYRRGVSAGDIFAGAVIIGGIAAIASAANNNRRRERDVVIVEREQRVVDERRVDDRRTNRSTTGGSGIDNAVSICLNEIERDVRVDSVDGASRISSGWIVSGTLFNGSGFSCEIGNNGRISNIDFGGFGRSSDIGRGGPQTAVREEADGQWSATRYADARAAMRSDTISGPAPERGSEPLVALTSDNLPAYPGGPVAGQPGLE